MELTDNIISNYGLFGASLVLFGTSTYILYNDWCQRSIFNNEFMKNYKIGNKKLFSGYLSSSDITQNNNEILFKYNWRELKLIPANPLCTFEQYNKYIFPQFNLINKHVGKYIDIIPERDLADIDCNETWECGVKYNYAKPYLYLNKVPVKIDDECKILYTSHKEHTICRNSVVIEKYIPDNTLVGILATEIFNPDKSAIEYQAEYIGTTDNLIDNIAQDHYDISTESTVFWISGLILSGIFFVKSLN